MGNSKKTKRTTAGAALAPEPDHHDLMRGPDLTASAAVRFTCGVYVRLTHPDYKPQQVAELLGQGQVQLEPLAPGQVGTLILDGFPYTVLGYYTFSAEDADYELTPAGWSCPGTAKAEAVKRRRPGRGR